MVSLFLNECLRLPDDEELVDDEEEERPFEAELLLLEVSVLDELLLDESVQL